ncbi:MAG: hypothetical protein ACRDTF_03955 [Pseudonocardiaceae bacterium]
MRLERLAKDGDSGEKGCQSFWDDLDSSDFVVLGPGVDTTDMENVLPGEVAVRIKRKIVIEAIRRYMDR